MTLKPCNDKDAFKLLKQFCALALDQDIGFFQGYRYTGASSKMSRTQTQSNVITSPTILARKNWASGVLHIYIMPATMYIKCQINIHACLTLHNEVSFSGQHSSIHQMSMTCYDCIS